MNKQRYLTIMLPTLLVILILLFLPPFGLKLGLCMLLLSCAMFIVSQPQPAPVKVKNRSERHR